MSRYSSDVECSSDNKAQLDDDDDKAQAPADIMSWFGDLPTPRNKTKRQVMSETRQLMSEHQIWSRLVDSKQRRAAVAFGQLAHRSPLHVSYPASSELRPLDMSDSANAALLETLKYAIRHALASYKKIKLALRTKEPSIALKSTKRLLRDHLGIAPADILVDNSRRNRRHGLRNQVHAPRFYLCVDRRARRIVLSVRGTASTADRATDLHRSLHMRRLVNESMQHGRSSLTASSRLKKHISVPLSQLKKIQ